MNLDRLLRDIETRLEKLPEDARKEALDPVREEVARGRRGSERSATIEGERERRKEAETLRAALEGISRQTLLDDTVEEVLRQMGRIVTTDVAWLSLIDPDGTYRVAAATGFPERNVIDKRYKDDASDEVRRTRQPLTVTDAQTDERVVPLDSETQVRSWAALPLLVEGEVIGVIGIARSRVDAFQEEDVHRAKTVAFSGAVAIRRARQHEQIQRYSAMMDWVVSVYQEAVAGDGEQKIATMIMEGAVRLGYLGALLVSTGVGKPKVVAALGSGFEKAVGKKAPQKLDVTVPIRFEAAESKKLGKSIGLKLDDQVLYSVPMSHGVAHVGSLVLVDTGGEGPMDAITQGYASRVAHAYVFASEGKS